jgi:flagellin
MSFRINTNVNSMNTLRVLGHTQNSYSKTMTRLSTGLRINDGSDDPAGLIFSENFRSQIEGTGQAIRNNQDALNFAKTAEGALDEVSRLMREARTLAVAAGNHGILSSDQKAAYQVQMNLLLNSVDRVAQTTQFGKIKLLDGSSGVNAVVVNSTNIDTISLGGKIGSQAVTTGGAISVNVTTAATKGSHSGTNTVAAASLAAYQAAAVGSSESFSVNGTTFQIEASETWGQVVQKINAASAQTGVIAEATYGGGNGNITLRTVDYGTNAAINLVDATGVINAAAGVTSVTGVNAVAQVTVGGLNPVTFTGGQTGNSGLTLTDANGNRIVLTAAGNVTGSITAGQAMVGSVNFQVGTNAGEVANLSLGNFATTAMGMNGLDVTTAAGVESALTKIDSALDELNRRRGDIGSFMRNTLESNIRSLGVTKENLSATESAVRDIDVAEEMTKFTKLQILSQSGLAMLTQANQAPQQVLSLLRGG